MKYTYLFALLSFLLLSCGNKPRQDNFSGRWQMVSVTKNGKPFPLPKDKTIGILYTVNKDRGLYVLELTGIKFLLTQTDNYYLNGTNYTDYVRYIPETKHLIFDLENDSSIMEFERVSD